MDERLTVGKVAQLVGVSRDTVLRYEKRGYIEARRSPINGYRVFDRQDVERLRTLLDGR